MGKSKYGPGYVTKADGNIFLDIGFSEPEATLMKMKVDLHIEIIRMIRSKKLTPRALEKLFDEPQPRISELMRGRTKNLSVMKLTDYAIKLGLRPKIAFDKPRAA